MPSTKPKPTLEARIADLEQQLAILPHRNAAAAEDDAAAKAATPSVAAGAGGFSLSSRDQAADSIQLRRVRPIIEGIPANTFSFRFMADFGLGRPSVQHAYIDGSFHPQCKIRVGKLKVDDRPDEQALCTRVQVSW